MTRQIRFQGPRLSRRHTMRLAGALGAGMVFGTASFPSTIAAATYRAGSAASEAYAHPEALVDATWLGEHQSDAGLVLVGFMPVEEFNIAHIPGSVQINAPELEVIDTSDASIESWQETTQQLLGDLGITPDSTVVVYDNGTLFSARLWWILHYFGHEAVHILDGGLAAWQEADNDVEEGPARAATGGEPYQGTPNADRLAQMDEVEASLDDSSVAILDARTPEEYAEGHIPGALNLNFPLNAAPEPPKHFKSAAELTAMYGEIGVTPDRLIIPYCASGVRSSVTAFALHLIGYDQVAVYTGSWLEWGEDPDAPKAEGDAP